MCLVNPMGNFPLNDDWHFAYPVKSLLENGEYRLLSQLPPNIFLHVVWGYLWTWFFGGFSFTCLRFSTLFLSAAGIVFFYQLVKSTLVDRQAALWIALLLLFNPLYFSLSFTFMTDVPFLVYAMGSLLCYWYYLDRNRPVYRIAGLLLALAAFLIRQPGIFIPVCFEGVLWLYRRQSFGRFAGKLVLLIALYLFIEQVFKPWLQTNDNYIPVDQIYFLKLTQPITFVFNLGKYLTLSVFYFGVFLLPWSLYFVKKTLSLKSGKTFLAANMLGGIVLTIVFYQAGFIFPFGKNLLYNLGVGPPLLPDIRTFGAPISWSTALTPLMILGWLSWLNGGNIIAYLMRKEWLAWRSEGEGNLWGSFLIFLFMIYLLAMCVFSFFDRYLLLPYVCLILLILQNREIYFFTNPGKLVVVFLIWFSITATRDYMMWNRLVQQSLTELVAQGVTATDIDGGVANNGWITGDTKNPDAEYMITFHSLEGFQTLKSYEWNSWLTFSRRTIFTLKRE